MELVSTVARQREILCSWVEGPLSKAAVECGSSFGIISECIPIIQEHLQKLPEYSVAYAMDHNFVQVSPNITAEGMDYDAFGEDLSGRPFLAEWSTNREFFLSRLYISRHTDRPCFTALQAVRCDDGELMGLIAVDFGPSKDSCKGVQQPDHLQVKGDPSIRDQLFRQTRNFSEMERRIDEVHRVVEILLLKKGVFYVELKYSSSVATLWFSHDPFTNHVWSIDELLDSDLLSHLPEAPYDSTKISMEDVCNSLMIMKTLRLCDDNVYLRSSSMNVMTGMVALNFSCDGTHFMPSNVFLDKGEGFWFTDDAACDSSTTRIGLPHLFEFDA